MEFESPDVEKEFPGLYASESGGKKSNESDYSDDCHEKHKKELLKSKDKKESKKDRGYAALEGESSAEETEQSPSKSKKSKAFKFPSMKEKREKSRDKENGPETEHPKEKENKEKEKKRDKDLHRISKLRSIKDKKAKTKNQDDVVDAIEEPPVFGVSLEVAVARSRCHDGVRLPLVVRNCLDFVEECGLTVDGIYKSSGNKNKAQQLRKLYNQKLPVNFIDCDPVTVAGLLKLFLKELPHPIVPATLSSEFEQAASKRGEGLEVLLDKMPSENRELLGWLVMHCKHLVANEKLNKCGGLQGVCATFAPLMQTSPKVLSALVCYASSLFPSIHVCRYVPPLSGPSPALPNTEAGCLEELRKLESLLGQVHSELAAGLAGPRREEQLWDAQRIVTQLKRKLRSLQKPLEPRASDDELRLELAEPSSAPPTTSASQTVSTTASTTTPAPSVTTVATASVTVSCSSANAIPVIPPPAAISVPISCAASIPAIPPPKPVIAGPVSTTSTTASGPTLSTTTTAPSIPAIPGPVANCVPAATVPVTPSSALPAAAGATDSKPPSAVPAQPASTPPEDEVVKFEVQEWKSIENTENAVIESRPRQKDAKIARATTLSGPTTGAVARPRVRPTAAQMKGRSLPSSARERPIPALPSATRVPAESRAKHLAAREAEELALQEELQALAEDLAQRVAAEQVDVQRLRLELDRVRAERRLRSPVGTDQQSNINMAQLVEKNRNLQQQRDVLCCLIIQEQEAIARTKAQLRLRRQNQQQQVQVAPAGVPPPQHVHDKAAKREAIKCRADRA